MRNEELGQIAEMIAEKISLAKDANRYFSYPFKHIVIDDLLPNELAINLLEAFPSADTYA